MLSTRPRYSVTWSSSSCRSDINGRQWRRFNRISANESSLSSLRRRVIPVASLITKDANTKSYTKTDSQRKIMKGFEINIRCSGVKRRMEIEVGSKES